MDRHRIGMFGGKFIPFHKGHRYCLDIARRQCDTVYCIMFVNGADEDRIRLTEAQKIERQRLFENGVREFDNVIPKIVDVADCRLPDGNEDWDAETPLVRNIVGPCLDRVYSSEPSYDDYFRRVYPEAKHILIDPERVQYPISGTMIRSIWNSDERWRMYI